MPDFGRGRSGVLPSDYNLPDGWIAEKYYEHLKQPSQQAFSQESGSQSDARSKQTGQAAASSTAQQHGTQAPQGNTTQQHGTQAAHASISQQYPPNTGQADLADTTPQPNTPPRLDEGSGIDGQSRAWELSTENEETPALSDFDRRVLSEEVARRILETQKTRGTLPVGWVRWAKETLKPRVDWRKHLQRAVRGAISEGFGQLSTTRGDAPTDAALSTHPSSCPACRANTNRAWSASSTPQAP